MSGNVTVDYSHLNRVESKIDELTKESARVNERINAMGNTLSSMNGSITDVKTELNSLRSQFVQMMADRKKAEALQHSATELIRVRQELEQEFGNYRVIRETMLGVLQATDLALVKQATISNVSEELMLSTPEYWLAPCLVAISAWISNERDLAERAIREAVRRDEEKTALTMALICRRNGRTQTSYEWLAIYFSHQDTANFSEGSLAYIDAYLNGIFGPDEKHMCDDYIAKWTAEIKGQSAEVEAQQEQIWSEYCKGFACSIDSKFPDLKEGVLEYDRIKDYVGRIESVPSIQKSFGDIMGRKVDSVALKDKIDKNLILLISRYDEKELPLRREEAYHLAVKAYDGDTEAAKRAIVAKEQERREHTLNLIEQMSNAILQKDKSSSSEKKTAVSFLSSYIRKGFASYMEEKRGSFPQQVTVSVNGWQGVCDGQNGMELQGEYEKYMTGKKVEEISKVNTGNAKLKRIFAIVTLVLTILCLVIWPVAIAFAIASAVLFITSAQAKKNDEKKIAEIEKEYAESIGAGKQKIQSITEQWQNARQLVGAYELNPVTEIVA